MFAKKQVFVSECCLRRFNERMETAQEEADFERLVLLEQQEELSLVTNRVFADTRTYIWNLFDKPWSSVYSKVCIDS